MHFYAFCQNLHFRGLHDLKKKKNQYMYKNHINFCLSYLNKHTGLKYKLKHNLSCQTNISHLQFLNFIILKEIIYTYDRSLYHI